MTTETTSEPSGECTWFVLTMREPRDRMLVMVTHRPTGTSTAARGPRAEAAELEQSCKRRILAALEDQR